MPSFRFYSVHLIAKRKESKNVSVSGDDAHAIIHPILVDTEDNRWKKSPGTVQPPPRTKPLSS